ncbi:unnamed protein product [Rotaria socialis]
MTLKNHQKLKLIYVRNIFSGIPNVDTNKKNIFIQIRRDACEKEILVCIEMYSVISFLFSYIFYRDPNMPNTLSSTT